MGPCYIMSLCVCQHSEEMYFYHLSLLCYYTMVMHSRRKMATYLQLIGATFWANWKIVRNLHICRNSGT